MRCAAAVLLLCACARAELVLDVSGNLYDGSAVWTDTSSKGNDVTMQGSWGATFRAAEKDFLFTAGQTAQVMQAPSPVSLGVTEDWTLTASFAPNAPWTGHMTIMSCVSASNTVFSMYLATDADHVTYVDFESVGFPVTAGTTDGWPHIKLGKYEDTQVTVTFEKVGAAYQVCAYGNGVEKGCKPVTAAQYAAGQFNLAQCTGFVLNQEQTSVNGGYAATTAYVGKFFGAKLYTDAIDVSTVEKDFVAFNSNHGVCRTNLELYYDAGLTSSYSGCSGGSCPETITDLSGNGRDGKVLSGTGTEYWQPYHNGVFQYPDTGYDSLQDYIELNEAALQAVGSGSYTIEMVVAPSQLASNIHHLSNVVDSAGNILSGLHTGAGGTDSSAMRECPTGWSYHNTHCYKLVGNVGTYAEATAKCKADGAHLMSVQSKDEFTFVRDLATAANVGDFWVGAKRVSASAQYLFEDATVLTSSSYFPLLPKTASIAAGGLLAEWDFTQGGLCATSGAALCFADWDTSATVFGQGGLYLDGTAAVRAPLAAALKDRTLELWVKGVDGMRGHDMGLIGLASSTGPEFDVLSPGENDGHSASAVDYIFYAGSSEAGQRGNLNGQPLHAHEWVHVAISYDSSANEVVVYLNGYEYGKASVSAVAEFAAGDYVTLGRRSDSDVLASSFKGVFARAAVFSKALSAADVMARFTEGNPFPKASGTDLCAKMVDVNVDGMERAGPSVYEADCSVSLPYVCKEDGNDLKFHLDPSLSGASFSNNVMMQVGISYDATNKRTTLIKDGKQVEWLAGEERPVGAVAAKGWLWNVMQQDDTGILTIAPASAFTGQLVNIRVYSEVVDEMCLLQNWEYTKERFSVVSQGLLVHYDARAKESYPTWGNAWKDIHVQDGATGTVHDASLASPVWWNTRHSGCFDSHPDNVPAGPSPITLGHQALQSINPADGYTFEYRLEPSVSAGTVHEFNFVQDSGNAHILSFQVNGDTQMIEVLDTSGSVISGLGQPVVDGEVIQFGFIMLPGGKAQSYKDGVASAVVSIGSQIDVSAAGAWYANAVPGSATEKFYGCLLDIRLYDHPLTYDEIEQNFGDCAVCKSDTCTCALCDNECHECNDGWIGGPDQDCRVSCDMFSCSEHGIGIPNASPTILADTCLCQCNEQWTGATCDTCPSQYEQHTCAACAAGLFDYPACGTCSAGHCLNGGAGNEVTYSKGDVVNIFADATTTNTVTTNQITMNINSNYKNGDTLKYSGSRTDLKETWNKDKGTLVVKRTNNAQMKLTEWAAILRDITFQSTDSSTAMRTATYSYGAALLFSDTGHWYEMVSGSYSWKTAKSMCEKRQILGINGYLATITSQEENDMVSFKLTGNAYIGGADDPRKGEMRWKTGPEGLMDGGKGMLIGTGTRGSYRAKSYDNFRIKGNSYREPSGGKEQYIQYWGQDNVSFRKGRWNDVSSNSKGANALCEYGGMVGDDISQFSGIGFVQSSCGCECPSDTQYTGTTCETCPAAFVVENARVDVNPALYADTAGVAGCESDNGPFGPCLSQKNRGIHLPYLCSGDDCYAVSEGGTAYTSAKATIEMSVRILGNEPASQPLLGLYQMNDAGFDSYGMFFPHIYAKFSGGATGDLLFAQSASGATVTLGTSVVVNTKYMIAVTFDSTLASNKRLCIYVNGALDTCVACTETELFLGGGHSTTDFNIQLLGAGGAGTTTAADAELMDFALFGTRRSTSQLRKNDDTTLSGSTSGLLVYYRDEGVAGTGEPLTWSCGEQFNAAVKPKAGLCERGMRAGTNDQADTFKYHWLKDMTGNNRHAFVVGGTFVKEANCDECAIGNRVYPDCDVPCDDTLCNGNGAMVRKEYGCSCTCDDMWSYDATAALAGTRRVDMDDADLCKTCASPYDAAADCKACLTGYANYPDCYLCDAMVGSVQTANRTHCHDHGKPVPNGNVCECECEDAWQGAVCDTCPSNYQYTSGACKDCADMHAGPLCILCTVQLNCSDQATAVASSADKTTCDCTCRNQWGGLTCDTCPTGVDPAADCGECLPGHINYPTCTPCDVDTHCNSHASTVTSDPAFATCLCVCRNSWSGLTCDTCSMQFGGTDCDACSGNGHTYPVCEECTVLDHCNNHATAATADPPMNPTGCACDCTNYWGSDDCSTCDAKYGGTDCDECALGHVDAPACRECTVIDDCNNRAGSVTSNAARDTCECVACHDQWTGLSCDQCAMVFNQTTCDECIDQYIGYPTCTECTDAVHCSGHSSSVTHNNDKTACVCTCATGFTGVTCDQCDVGYIGYPACTQCTDATHCSGNSVSVVSSVGNTACECTCKVGFSGTTCDECDTGYAGYPACVQCTVISHCSGNSPGVTVSMDKATCVCDACNDQFTGGACDGCDAKYDPTTCDECAAGHINYPTCTECTVATHCNGRAGSVTTNNALTCMCIACSAQWTGDDCDSCAVIYNAISCDECADNHIDYPACTECTDVDHCNGNSVSVYNNVDKTLCECTCKVGFTGASCDECAVGYIGYPACTECTVAAHCNGRAASVFSSTDRLTCVCDTCADQWGGSMCETCDAKYNTTGCDECADTHINYPTCTECTDPVHCNGNSASVTHNDDKTTCVCTCKTGFTGATCDQCDVGHINYPVCTECTNATHCNSHAGSVASSADKSVCECNDCIDQWTGDACETCPSLFSTAADCKECADGRITYPTCTLCTLEDHCTNHATTVVTSADKTTCDCTCRNQWGGLTCDTCPTGVDPAADCGECLPGHINYPTCTPCDVDTHCNSHAGTVTSDPAFATCTCACRNMWSGATCDTCSMQFGGADCDMCSGNGHAYPVCDECTVLDHCNNHATAATADPPAAPTHCACDCTNYWSSDDCVTCDAKYGGTDCDECALGHVDAPDCRECTVVDDCNNRAGSVTSNAARDTCECVACHDQWTGLSCDQCAMVFNQVTCSECAAGHVNYPTCTECTDAVHCSGHSTSVTHNNDKSTCVCTCATGFTGASCGECAAGYIGYPACIECTDDVHCSSHSSAVTHNVNKTECSCTCNAGFAGVMCDECAAGFAGYPNCTECTVIDHCNGHTGGVTVSADKATCVCDTCYHQWSGDACELCAAKYDPATCDMCHDGHVDFPTCTPCNDAVHCSGHSVSVSHNTNKTACVCTCDAGFTGTACDECSPGHVNYPSCTQCTVTAHCNGRATSVDASSDKTTCVCGPCTDEWTGVSCNECDAKYNQTNCAWCTDGHIDFPTCTKCNEDLHCNGNSDSVTHNNDKTVCACTCKVGYAGVTCDQCASGYIGYPSCVACTVALHCSGNAGTVTSSTDNTKCECGPCNDQWSGDECNTCGPNYDPTTCDACSDDHVGYPACTLCTDAASCNGNSDSVTHNDDKTACACTCKAGFQGAVCDECAAGHINYPTCTECTVAAHCNGRTDSVTASTDGTKCVCGNCHDQWTGDTCDVCSDAKFNQMTCDACAVGFVGYPVCTECTNPLHCNDRAGTVSSNVDNTVCECTMCMDQWTGAACETCPSLFLQTATDCKECAGDRITYPTCTLCTVEDHCSNQGTNVAASADKTTCDCTCRNQWGGATCDRCPPGVDPDADCGECLPGHIGYPTCVQCNVDTHCNSHAGTVTSDPTFTTCLCDCRNMWSGLTCADCSTQFAGADCDACSGNTHAYPVCDECTVLDHCNKHATAATADPPAAPTQCTCECTNYWSSDDCVTCEAKYGGTDCDECALGHVVAPDCRECTVVDDCNNRAGSVTSNDARDACECVGCIDQWTGAGCDECASMYDKAGCDMCANHHIDYPTCTPCTDDVHCSSHSSFVTHNDDKTACVCTCAAGFTGAACDQCAAGYIGYPACSECSTAVHCNARSDSVAASADGASCVCGTCYHQWTGAQCDDCAMIYNQATCQECADGLVGYPVCSQCTNAVHCNDRAGSVATNADQSGCECSMCIDQWTGDACETCPSLFSETADCKECADGRITYPTCTLCTVEDHCLDHASAVVPSADMSVCECTCRNQWGGLTCDTCPTGVDPDADCGECLPGHINYPTCTPCDVDTHCNGHSETVASDVSFTECMCKCENQWTGATCDECPAKFGGADCDVCSGNGHTFPICEECTVLDHCNNHATVATAFPATNPTGCTCECTNYWSGDDCGTCADIYGGTDCDECALGHVDAPDCRACTVVDDCNNRAKSVLSNAARDTCECVACHDQWTGSSCDVCVSIYDQTTCDMCADGHAAYPTCAQCTDDVHCSSHSTSVTHNADKSACACECAAEFAGAACDECADGHINYPTCTPCTDDVHCSSHSSAVTHNVNKTECSCTCNTGFAGATCDECAAGFAGYPECTECTVRSHCNGHAVNVSVSADAATCECGVCLAQWTGAQCDTCDTRFSATCDSCADGHVNYPNCTQCAHDVHCSGHSSAVTHSFDRTECTCTCDEGFAGANCSECAAGHISYPVCTECANDVHCSAHGIASSNANNTLCTCECNDAYTGAQCDVCPSNYDQAGCATCAAGFVNYPSCTACDVDQHCNGHALNVTATLDGRTCNCTCADEWEGNTCNTCDAKYNATNCAECAEGLVDYPTCVTPGNIGNAADGSGDDDDDASLWWLWLLLALLLLCSSILAAAYVCIHTPPTPVPPTHHTPTHPTNTNPNPTGPAEAQEGEHRRG